MSQHTLEPSRVKSLPQSSGALLQRKCTCGQHTGGGECEECHKKKQSLQRKERDGVEPVDVPQSVYEVLRSPGKPLDLSIRTFMESRFGHDFSHVRIHDHEMAMKSARELNARAYTVGKSLVFGAGEFAPRTEAGRGLLAHELTHVVQQESAANLSSQLALGRQDEASEHEAERVATIVGPLQAKDSNNEVVPVTGIASGKVQRQLITPLAPGGGFGGLMERDRQASIALAASPYHVCSRPLQGVLGLFANHAYVEAPPYRYAIISPLCGQGSDNPVTGTTAQKWDNSPDPCGKTRQCVPCRPAPGVTDIGRCLQSAFTTYNALSLYRATGPNSNTFAGTLARTCCAGMVPQPAALGTVPGWNDPPAPSRAGATPCPPGPTC
jgi:uncharacterized protein DUF4157